MLTRIKDLTNRNVDFALETTPATRIYVQFIRKAKERGYFITLVYFWLNSPELALERVKARVTSGGHNIPEDVIFRRYWAGKSNLSKLYLPLCDYWLIIDNSEPPFQIIAEGFKTENIEIYNQVIYNQILKL